MPVDTGQWHAEIGNFNGCLHYVIIELEITLFNIMVRVRQALALILAITFKYVFKINRSFHFLNNFCLFCCLLSWNLQLLILVYVSNSVNIVTNKFHMYIVTVVNAVAYGYFLHLFLLQHGDIETNPGQRNDKTDKNFHVATGILIVH